MGNCMWWPLHQRQVRTIIQPSGTLASGRPYLSPPDDLPMPLPLSKSVQTRRRLRPRRLRDHADLHRRSALVALVVERRSASHEALHRLLQVI
eukprot:16067367-Heterocapsa_arctica.AAC.1